MYSGLYAAFYYMKACYPYLKESKGSVINFASGAGLFGNFGQCAYAAAKEGIRGLTRVAATEWAKDGINVNIICPLAWTSQLEQFKNAYPEAFDKNVHTPPAGHFGDAELEIGRVCVQLASPDFKYMTGETLTLEGGLGQRPQLMPTGGKVSARIAGNPEMFFAILLKQVIQQELIKKGTET